MSASEPPRDTRLSISCRVIRHGESAGQNGLYQILCPRQARRCHGPRHYITHLSDDVIVHCLRQHRILSSLSTLCSVKTLEYVKANWYVQVVGPYPRYATFSIVDGGAILTTMNIRFFFSFVPTRLIARSATIAHIHHVRHLSVLALKCCISYIAAGCLRYVRVGFKKRLLRASLAAGFFVPPLSGSPGINTLSTEAKQLRRPLGDFWHSKCHPSGNLR